MKKWIRKIAFAIMVTLLMAGTTGVVFAEETATQTGTEPEKELVLYNADGDIDGDGVEDLWVGFRYETDDYESYLEVSYNGKSLTSLVEEGYIIKYRTFTRSSASSSDSYSDWINIDYLDINENIIFCDFNTCQFKISSNDGNLISISDKVVASSIWITFPIVISAEPYIYSFDSYNLDGQSIKFTIKYNDCLNLIDANKVASISMDFIYGDGSMDNKVPFFPTNLEYTNYSESVTIDGEKYTWNYSLVTFYCNLAHYELVNTDKDSSKIGYEFTLKNLIGGYYNVEPSTFIFRSITYRDTSLNPQKKLVINNHENKLELDETIQLSTEVLSDEISTDGLIWVSSDENIAKVDENGLVTATGLGRAYIYATKEDTIELYDYCIVDVVEDIPVSNISLNVSTLSLKTGLEYQLVPTVEPENALDKIVTWTSSNETIATVDENGLVTAKGAGTVVITATSNYDSTISSSCNVTVTDPVYKVKSINITGIPKTVKPDSSFTLTAITSPSNATNSKVTWKSSNTKCATVNSRGSVSIKSAGAGKTVKITATAKDGSGVKKTVTLKISKIKVKKIALKASASSVAAGKTVKIKAAVSPGNATTKTLKWSSSNTKYAIVTSSGVVKTKKAGKGKTVKITAKTTDGSNVKATVTIKIK